jgi:acyl carrier protein
VCGLDDPRVIVPSRSPTVKTQLWGINRSRRLAIIGKTNQMNFSEQVREYVVSNFLFGDGATLQDDTSLLDSGTVDSMGVMELVMFLEAQYGLKVNPNEITPDNFDSINQIVQFITRRLPEPSKGSFHHPTARLRA